jgi:hypothetical protein
LYDAMLDQVEIVAIHEWHFLGVDIIKHSKRPYLLAIIFIETIE